MKMFRTLSESTKSRVGVLPFATVAHVRAVFLCFLLIFGTLPPGVLANPTNPSVQAGSATFSTSGSTSIIHQGSGNVIIHWDTFSIQQGETTRFIQPGSTSAALNRVTSGNPSEIYGNLQANGRVLLINPNGILVGPGGRIDTAGFLGSTLDVSDSDFLNGGDMIFSGNSSAKVVNLGTINAIDGGDIFLIAQEVENYGTLNAPGGTVGLAGGTRVMVKSEAMGERISILPGSKGGKVTNGASGTITAAVAELKAAGGNEYALAINNDGLVRATRFENRGGKIYLGSGGRSRVRNRGTLRAPKVQIKAPAATVENAGTIDASSEVGNGGEIEIEAESVIGTVGGFLNTTGLNKGGSIKITASGELRLDDSITAVGENGFGGSIRLSGDTVTLGDHAVVDASGATGGGTILVGGGRAGRDASIANARLTTVEEGANLVANATGVGDGGTVILWADDTMDFRGSVQNRGAGSGAGGFTEVSGLRSLGFHGTVDTGGGDLLLDPFNYVIGAGEAANIVTALGMNNVTIDTTTDVGAFGSSGNAADVGDITVNSEILYDSENDFTFLAMGDVNFNASVQNRNGSANAGDINIVAGWDGTTAYDTATFSAVDVNAANPSLFGNQNGMSTGSVFIGDGTQTEGIAVGSRRGTTNVFAHDVALQGANSLGSRRFAQLGFQITDGIALGNNNLRPMGDADGRNVVVDGGITVHALNDLTATGGSDGGTNYAQVGHVGNDSDAVAGIEADASAVIELSLGNNIIFTGGAGGSGYAQLGQGGIGADGNHSGTITITTANDITFEGGGVRAYAQLGQGGARAEGSHSGTTTIISANDITFTGGTLFAYAQLGQGGDRADGNHSGTTTILSANDIAFTSGAGFGGDLAIAQLGQGGFRAEGNHSGLIDVTHSGDLTLTGDNTEDRYALIGHGNGLVDFFGDPDSDAGQTVSGEVMIRTGGDATLTNATIGHQINADGSYSSGLTYLGVVGDLTADASSRFTSAANADGGELRIYLGGMDNVDTATVLNGIAHGGTMFPNNQGMHIFGTGPYAVGGGANPVAGGNFNYYEIEQGIYNYTVGSTEAQAIAIALGSGDDVTLYRDFNQRDFGAHHDWDGGTQFITVDSDVFYDSTNTLTLIATGDINFNASVQNRNATGGGLDIVAGWNPANAGTPTGVSEAFTNAERNVLLDADVSTTTLYGRDGSPESTGSVFIGDGTQTSGIAVGSRRGTTNVFAHDVALQGANSGTSSFAQLGFQISDGIALGNNNLRPMGDTDGRNVVVDGGITIHARNDLTATGGSGGTFNYAQVGHVGGDPDSGGGGVIESDASAIIEVSTGNDVVFTGGAVGAYAQLGQGGDSAQGDHSGTTTISEARDIIFTAGGGGSSYAQLGQGGFRATGNHSGTIGITHTGNLTLTGQNTEDRYALIGHGDAPVFFDVFSGLASDSDAGQSVSGMVTVSTGGDIDVNNGFIGHLLDADGDSNTGDILVTAGGDITLSNHLERGSYDSPDDYTMLAEGDIHFNTSLQNRNATSGDINIVAGWDGTTGYNTGTFSAVDVNAAMPSLFGNQNGGSTGSVFIGDGTQTAGIAVGSRSGTTNVFGHDVALQGENGTGTLRFAQLGFQISDGIALGNNSLRPMGDTDGRNVVVDGGITIHARNDLTATGGSVGNFNYAQVGHVGADNASGGGGEIEADASAIIEISTGNDIVFTGGGGPNAYAQLGQGGALALGNHSGTTTISEARDISFTGGGTNAYAQLGQGGGSARGNHSGTTRISGARDVRFTSGAGARSDSILGQGGRGGNAANTRSGLIDVTLDGDLTLDGSAGANNFAQIGHFRGTAGQTVEGDTLVRIGGDATLTRGRIGHTGTYADVDGGGIEGNTYLGVGGDFTADAVSRFLSADNATQNGELRIYLADPSHDLVDAGAQFNGTAHGAVANPNDQGAFAFGMGPYDPGMSATGGAAVGGNFNYYVSSLTGFYNYIINGAEAAEIVAALASGDVDIDRNLNQANFGALLDTDGGTQFITVNNDIFYGSIYDLAFLTTGDINFNASVQNFDGSANAGDINIVAGWDGSTAYSTATYSAVDVNAATPTLFGNQGFETSAMTTPTTGSVFLGDGTQTSGIAVGSRRGTTNVFAHDVALRGSDVTPPATSAVKYFSQLGFQIQDGVGLGGNDLRPMGDIDGRNVVVDGGITVHALHDLSARGGDSVGGLGNYAQVGHVGSDPNFGGGEIEADASAMIEISTGNDIRFSGGTGNSAHAQLGQGGEFVRGDFSGTTTITTANDIVFAGGMGSGSYAHLGQGGESAIGNHGGTTTITRANDIRFLAGGGSTSYAQLGQGGHFAKGNHSGTTTIARANDIQFRGGADLDAYGQLGQGGYQSIGNHSGTTIISAANDITVSSGIRDNAYSQIGQGGGFAEGNHSGRIDITHTGDLTVNGRDNDDRYAQIGHSDGLIVFDFGTGMFVPDSDTGQTVDGLVTISSGGDVAVDNGFIGHVLGEEGASNTGDVLVEAGGDITLSNHLQFGSYDSPDDYTLLAEGDVHFNTSLQNRNATSGDINIVAGWDGTTGYNTGTFSAVDVNAAMPSLFGNQTGMSTGSVFLGDGSQTRGIAVGSRRGTTNVFAHDVSLQGANAAAPAGRSNFSQLGFQISDGIALGNNDLRPAGNTDGANVVVDGGITIHARSDLTATVGGRNNYAQVGHVGSDITQGGAGEGVEADASAMIEISTGNDIRFVADGGQSAYAQLGQGGIRTQGGFSGTITITTANDIVFQGGTRSEAYAQMGQGGDNASGSHSGTTTIMAANDIAFVAGAGERAYAQLGQGGGGADGSHSGSIDVIHTGDLTLTGRDTNFRYAIVGHGDELVAGNVLGGLGPENDAGSTVSGDVMIRTGGDATLRNATIGHQINRDGSYSSGLTYLGVDGDLTANAASRFVSAPRANGGELRIYLADPSHDLVATEARFNGRAHGAVANPNDQGAFDFGLGPYDPGNSATGGAAVGGNFNYYVSSLTGFYNYVINGGEAANIVAALAGGDVDIDRNLNQANFGALLDTDGGTQFITVNDNIFYGSIYDLAFLTTGDINFNASVQNFDGSADAGDINIVAGWDGSTAYDTATYSAVDVNAATPTLFGNQGFETSTMTTPTTGSVFIGDGSQTAGVAVGSRRGTTNVFGHDVSLSGGNGLGGDRFAQLGFQVTDGIALGGIDLDLANSGGANVVVDGAIVAHARNDLSATGGGGNGNYAQVGHVGASGDDNAIVEADASSEIEIAAGGDIRFVGGGGSSYAQLGQGGYEAEGNFGGTSTVTAEGDIEFRSILDSYAQLGQGGFDANGTHGGVTTVTAGNDIIFAAGRGNGHAQLGQGGTRANGNHSGTIMVTAGNNITFTGSDGAYAQLGQGGGSALGDHSGTITIVEANDIVFTGGGDNDSYAQLGNGGSNARGNHSGTITIVEAGDIRLTGGNDGNGYAQLGNGGESATGSHSGTITITLANDIVFAGGDGDGAYAQLGQGGSGASGNHSGTTTISVAGDIIFTGGGQSAYAQLGQGGALALGNHSGTTTISEAGDITFTGGNRGSAYAQLGQGGLSANGSHSGTTMIMNAEDITFTGGTENHSYAQLGNGGYAAIGDHSGTTTISEVGAITFTGDGDIAYAQLGQGGADANGDHSGTTTITKTGDIAFSGGEETDAYAQLGHGGDTARGDHSGETTISEVGGITFSGGDGRGSYAQLGQGGGSAQGNHGGTITITDANHIVFTGGGDNDTYAQLGNGGESAGGDHSGTVTITEAGNIRFTGGGDGDAYAQLGQGGANAVGSHSGMITITETNNIAFTGGRGGGAYAQLGQGGVDAVGSHSGTITITEVNNLVFAASNGGGAYAHLGQGGQDAEGNHTGTTTIRNQGDIRFSAGTAPEAYAQLGQGGDGADGNQSGMISIESDGDLVFSGGDTDGTFVQIGHGGDGNSGDHSGSVTVVVDGDIVLSGGIGNESYAQIGHGGINADGNHDGTIRVTSGGNLTLTGDNVTRSYALIGHGDQPGDSDAGDTVMGDVTVRVGGDATLTNAFIGHQINADGTYTSGNTFIGVGQDGSPIGGMEILTADMASQFNSAPGGELRFYIPERSGYQVAAGTLLNGTAAVAPGTNPLPNEQGRFVFGEGPYSLTAPGNFAFYFGGDPAVDPPVNPQPFDFANFDLPLDIKQVTIAEDLREDEEEKNEEEEQETTAEVPVVPADGQGGTFTTDEEGNTTFTPDGPPQSEVIHLQ